MLSPRSQKKKGLVQSTNDIAPHAYAHAYGHPLYGHPAYSGAFAAVDQDGDGKVSKKELAQAAKDALQGYPGYGYGVGVYGGPLAMPAVQKQNPVDPEAYVKAVEEGKIKPGAQYPYTAHPYVGISDQAYGGLVGKGKAYGYAHPVVAHPYSPYNLHYGADQVRAWNHTK